MALKLKSLAAPLGGKRMYRILVVIIAMLAFLSVLPVSSAATIPILIDGQEVASDTSPLLIQNRMMVPVRVISEYLGSEVSWDAPDVYISRNNVDLKLTLDSKTAYRNGTPLPPLDVAPFIKNNRVMVPLRFVAEGLGVETSFSSGRIIINSEPKTSFLSDKEIIYRDEFTVFGVKDDVLYIASALDVQSGRPAEELLRNKNVDVMQVEGETVFFAYHPPGTEARVSLYYVFQEGNLNRINIPVSKYLQLAGGYLYGVADSYPDLIDISINKPPYRGNLYRINISQPSEEQAIEWLGAEGYHYGYEIVFTDTGQVQGLVDWDQQPIIEIKNDGIYAIGVELHSANAISTYGYFIIELEGRGHQLVSTDDIKIHYFHK